MISVSSYTPDPKAAKNLESDLVVGIARIRPMVYSSKMVIVWFLSSDIVREFKAESRMSFTHSKLIYGLFICSIRSRSSRLSGLRSDGVCGTIIVLFTVSCV